MNEILYRTQAAHEIRRPLQTAREELDDYLTSQLPENQSIGGAEAVPEETDQELLLSMYYTGAAEAYVPLGITSSDEYIWTQVHNSQFLDLLKYANKEVAVDIAANIVLGSIYAGYGANDTERRQHVYENDMWTAAMAGQGDAFLLAARKYPELTALTGDPDRPVEHVANLIDSHRNAFAIGSLRTDLAHTDVVVPELATAPLAAQEWVTNSLAKAGNYDTARANLEYIPDHAALVRQMIQTHKMSQKTYQELGLAAAMPEDQVIDYAISRGTNPDQAIDISGLPAERQRELFNQVVEKGGYHGSISLLNNMLRSGFTELGPEQLDVMLQTPYFSGDLLAFKNLPPGYLGKLQDKNVSQYKIIEALQNFALEDRVELYEQLIGKPFQSNVIFENPEHFNFMSKADIIQAARDHDCLYTVAGNIHKYTDGSDTELVAELVESSWQARRVADNIGEMPAFDTEAFAASLQENGNYDGLLHCLPYAPFIDQQALFSEILKREDRNGPLYNQLGYFDQLDKQAVLEQLVDAAEPKIIASNMSYFGTELSDEILGRLKAMSGGTTAIADAMTSFASLDCKWLAEQLVTENETRTLGAVCAELVDGGVDAEWLFAQIKQDPDALDACSGFLRNKSFISSIGEPRIITAMFDAKSLYGLMGNLEKITDPGQQSQFVDMAITEKDTWAVGRAYRVFATRKSLIVQKLCQSGWEEPLLDGESGIRNEVFGNENKPDADVLMDWGGYVALYGQPDLYPDCDRTALEEKIVARPNPESIAAVIEMTQGRVSEKMLFPLVGTRHMGTIVNNLQKFSPETFSPGFVMACIEADDPSYAQIYEYSQQHIRLVEQSKQVFGGYPLPELIKHIRDINGEQGTPVSSDLCELGVSDRGNLGIEQFKRAVSRIRGELLAEAQSADSGEFIRTLADNTVAEQIGKYLTRFTETSWGKQDDKDEWKNLLHNYAEARSSAALLGKEFVKSEVYQTRSIDAKEFDSDKLDEDAINRYNVLLQSLESGLETANKARDGGFETLFGQVRSLLAAESQRLRQTRTKLEQERHDKGIAGVTARIDKIEAIQSMTAKDFIRATKNDFTMLKNLNVPGLEPVLRTGVFARAIRRSPGARKIAESLRGSTATLEHMVQLDQVVNHVINQEVYGTYFANKESMKSFQKIADTRALKQQITKVQKGETSGSTGLQFVPSRGLLLELSGHIGDACWASEYKSIGAEFPHITSLTYLRNPGKKTERVVGAGLIIQTKDMDSGEDIMVLRGTNPIENYINGVKVEDFYTALLDYTKRVAGKRRIAAVMDKDSGDAATNRQVVMDYINNTLKARSTHTKPIKLPNDTTFNHYKLTPAEGHPVYYID